MPDASTPHAGFTHREILHMLSGTVLGMFLGALDQTIVSTSLPAMVGELHGMERMSWVVSAYLLTATAATPIYGKLSDLYGRRTLFRIAIAVFLTGSTVCSLAVSMTMLIAGRALQGVGGGGLISLALTIIADIIPPRERGRYQAYFTSVWSCATVGGPMIGGFLVDSISWRAVFWINLPIGLAALAICSGALKRLPVHGRSKPIDYQGALLLLPAIVALLLVTTWAGSGLALTSPTTLGLVAFAAALIVLLILRERRAEDPLLPPRLFHSNVFVVGNGIAALMGGAAVGATVFLPLYLQVVMGASAGNSGLLILPYMIGITLGATLTGRFIRITGRYKIVPLIGLGVASASFILFMTMTQATSPHLYGAYMAALGFGLGPAGPMVTIAVQNAVDPRDMGTATSLTSFFRSMGGSFGVAILGAILFAALTHHGPAAGLSPNNLLHGGPQMIASLPATARQATIADFAQAYRYVYGTGAVICAMGLVFALFIKELPLRSKLPPAQPSQASRAANGAPTAEAAENSFALGAPE